MILIALALAEANPYAKYAPATLIVMPPNQPAVTVDYQTMERCQRARAELLRQDHENDARDSAGDKALAEQIGRPVIRQRIAAYCIPK